jgi:hypothetical protein
MRRAVRVKPVVMGMVTCERRELTVVRPLLELGSWGVRGDSYIEVPTCEVLKH